MEVKLSGVSTSFKGFIPMYCFSDHGNGSDSYHIGPDVDYYKYKFIKLIN